MTSNTEIRSCLFKGEQKLKTQSAHSDSVFCVWCWSLPLSHYVKRFEFTRPKEVYFLGVFMKFEILKDDAKNHGCANKVDESF